MKLFPVSSTPCDGTLNESRFLFINEDWLGTRDTLSRESDRLSSDTQFR